MLSSTEPTDAELVSQALRGKKDAYGALVDRYRNLACSLAFSSSGNLARSEDLAQEAFLAAWKSLPKLQEPASFRPWLCGIVRNLGNNAARRRSRNAIDTASDLEEVSREAASQESPLEAVISHEEAELIWQSLDQLPETYREPLVLYYREEQSIPRVAEALDLSQDVVKQRLSRGRKLLKNQVSELVETVITRSKPTNVFVTAVLASLPAFAPQAATAAAAASATKGSTVAKSAAMAGMSGAIMGPLLGILGAWFGMSRAIKGAKSEPERAFIKRMGWMTMGLVVMFSATLLGVILLSKQLVPDHPRVYAGLLVGTNIGYMIALFAFILWSNRRLRQIQQQEGTYVKPEAWGMPQDSTGRASRKHIIGAYAGGMGGGAIGCVVLPYQAGDWLSVAILVPVAIVLAILGIRATLVQPKNSLQHMSWTFGILGVVLVGLINFRVGHWFPQITNNPSIYAPDLLKWLRWGMSGFMILLYGMIIGSWWWIKKDGDSTEEQTR